jgi:hypothetical protein
MNTHVCNLCVVLAALTAIWLSGATSPVMGEPVHYEFNFDDGMVPDVLEVDKFRLGNDPTETLTCDASGGQLRIYDTVSASCGMAFALDQLFTDTHISAVLNPDGGFPRGNYFLDARNLVALGAETYYECYLWSSPATNGVAMVMDKYINGQQFHYQATNTLPYPGPYVMELDVVDGENVIGEYTDVTARLIYDNGQKSVSLPWRDFGSDGDRLTSGVAAFGLSLGPGQRNANWVLDTELDNVVISATPVPEPATVVVLLTGMAAVALWFCRRRVAA